MKRDELKLGDTVILKHNLTIDDSGFNYGNEHTIDYIDKDGELYTTVCTSESGEPDDVDENLVKIDKEEIDYYETNNVKSRLA